MRRLAAASFAFSAAVFIANYILPVSWLPFISIATALFGVCLLLLRRRWLRGAIICLIAFAVGLTCFYIHYQRYTVPAHELDGQTMEISARVIDLPQNYGNYTRVRVQLKAPGAGRMEALVYDYYNALDALSPGDEISFTASLRSADTKYGEDYGYYNSRDIYINATVKSAISVKEGSFSLKFAPLFIKEKISGLIYSVFPEDTRGFMRALMLGDKSGLYDDTPAYSAMKRAGIMHAVAVSGMHIAFLVGLIQLLFGAGRKSSLLCICLVWLFVLVTGSTHSALRAGIMQTFLLLAPVLRRENDPTTSLSAALALILLFNPYAAAGVGLQLSFAAMAGIMCFSQRLNDAFTRNLPEGRVGRALSYVLGTAASSVAVMIFTVPLMAVHFGYVSLLSPITNILVLWAVSLCFCGGYIACALAAVFIPLGRIAAWIISWAARYVLLACKAVASLDFFCVYMNKMPFICWLAIAYMLIFTAALSRKNRGRRAAFAGAAALLSLAAVRYCVQTDYRAQTGVITSLDVGQGQCICVFSGEDTLMIDCGGIFSLEDAGERATAYLNSCGREAVDVLLLTHLHEDHANGVLSLLEAVRVGMIIVPRETDDSDKMLSSIALSAERNNTELVYLAQDSILTVGNIRAELYAPADTGDKNERCIFAEVSVFSFDMLVTGDAPMSAERRFVKEHSPVDMELLIVGHHGSRYSNSEELLSSIGADTAVISVGYNTYGHPAEETLDRLSACGYNEVYRTDTDGTVEIRIGSGYG